jgi:hypothetical protein
MMEKPEEFGSRTERLVTAEVWRWYKELQRRGIRVTLQLDVVGPKAGALGKEIVFSLISVLPDGKDLCSGIIIQQADEGFLTNVDLKEHVERMVLGLLQQLVDAQVITQEKMDMAVKEILALGQ